MFFEKKVEDLMIPLSDYAVTSPEKKLKDAVLEMRKPCGLEFRKMNQGIHILSFGFPY